MQSVRREIFPPVSSGVKLTIEPPHNLYCPLVTPKGVIYSVNHVIVARSENTIWTEVRSVDTSETRWGYRLPADNRHSTGAKVKEEFRDSISTSTEAGTHG